MGGAGCRLAWRGWLELLRGFVAENVARISDVLMSIIARSGGKTEIALANWISWHGRSGLVS